MFMCEGTGTRANEESEESWATKSWTGVTIQTSERANYQASLILSVEQTQTSILSQPNPILSFLVPCWAVEKPHQCRRRGSLINSAHSTEEGKRCVDLLGC
jgi:hypothetical protein